MNNDEINEKDQELYEHHHFVVDKRQSPIRIDKFLSQKIENISRNKIQNAAAASCILVNKKAVKPNYKIKPEDNISVVMPQPIREIELIAEDIPLNILYEDKDLAVVNKKAGMVVHPSFGHSNGTLVNALLYYFNDLPTNGEFDTRPGLVHRIDKNTSGLLVVAKNEITQTRLAKYFFDHDIERKYVALIWGEPEEESGTITGHLGRDPKNRKNIIVFPEGETGKHAVTHYKVIEKFGYTTLIECKLETGRTHQIRSHFRHIKHPLFGDPEYGGDKIIKGTTFTKYQQFIKNCFSIIPRQALHAQSLGFIHPTTNKYVHFESDLPEDMTEVLNKWRHYISYNNVGKGDH